MTKNFLQTIGRSHFFRHVEKYLNVFYMTRCLIFFITNHLISTNQSGFKPGDSCINQLLSVANEIYSLLDEGYDVRGVFLDISKAFDKVWHAGLIFKLEQNGISGKLLRLIKDFLRRHDAMKTYRLNFFKFS